MSRTYSAPRIYILPSPLLFWPIVSHLFRGAVYNVVNTDTALGKSRKKLRTAAERPGARAAHARYCEFMAQHGATEIMSTPEQPLEVQELRLFNKCISKRVIFQNKIRYYFLGINIGTRRIIRE